MAKGGKRTGAGRPVGSTTKPRFSDFMTEDEVLAIVAKAKEMALGGNEAMLKLIIEQKFGKAIQPVEGDFTGNLTLSFDKTFDASSNSAS